MTRTPGTIRRLALPAACGLALLAACGAALAQAGPESSKVRVAPAPTARFLPLQITVDPADRPLAAWQFELTCDDPAVRIVGLEGSAHPAYASAPYYDPAAMRTNRVIAAAYSTAPAQDLPRDKTRIATVHVMIPAGSTPTFTLNLTAAAGPLGLKLPAASATLTEGPVR